MLFLQITGLRLARLVIATERSKRRAEQRVIARSETGPRSKSGEKQSRDEIADYLFLLNIQAARRVVSGIDKISPMLETKVLTISSAIIS